MKQLDSTPLPYGAGKTWHNHYVRAGFLRRTGGLYGVKLVLTLDNAKKLRNDLRDCMELARKHSRNNIEIDAHFGAEQKEGFIMKVKVFRPEEKD